MKIPHYFLVFFIVPYLSFGQIITEFTGSAVDDQFTPIENAIVAIEGTAFAKTTDSLGRFMFSENLPTGEHIVTVSKSGYETKYIIVNVVNGTAVSANNIPLELTKEERKARDKANKELARQQRDANKEEQKKIKEARKAKEKEEKRLAKERRKLEKRGNSENVIVDYKPLDGVTPEDIKTVPEILPIQEKYAAILEVVPNSIVNTQLYTFIDEWMGTPYKMGGANHEGIDCSSFTQMLFSKIYDIYIERTAETQFTSKFTDKFEGREFLKEGDLLFFKQVNDESENITHVGVYLQNDKFVHATSNRDKNGKRGVQISNIEDNYWLKRLVAAGRRISK